MSLAQCIHDTFIISSFLKQFDNFGGVNSYQPTEVCCRQSRKRKWIAITLKRGKILCYDEIFSFYYKRQAYIITISML